MFWPARIAEENLFPWNRLWIRTRGGGVLGLEKGTNCGPTAAERWLLQREMAKKRGLSSYYIVR